MPAIASETIGESFRKTVERFADHDALVAPQQGVRATYAELWQHVDRAARAFLALGVNRGDAVGVWAPGSYEWVVTQLAAARVGAMLVTIDPACQPEELEVQLRKGLVRILVMTRGFRGADHLSHRDVLDCARGAGTRPVLHERLAALVGNLVCASHGACVVI